MTSALRSACTWLLWATLACSPWAGAQAAQPQGAVGGAPLPSRDTVRGWVAEQAPKAERLAKLRRELEPYLAHHARETDWLSSRLQMYWQGRHTQVFVKDSLYERASGQAPVPTVRFTGGRDTATAYRTPSLEEVKPYMGEGDRLWLQPKEPAQAAWEWAEHAKTGRIIESINRKVAEVARDAAFLYWFEGHPQAARMAYGVLDTYLHGIYHRELPTDLRRGHDQNIVGLQSYEVIHEDILVPLTEAYALLGPYIDEQGADRRALYDAALKKWADVLLLNGVPWNNWNLIKAKFVLQVASVLRPNTAYADGRGREHYVRAVIEGQAPRHWGLQRLADFGYDPRSAMWNESASYAVLVLDEFAECLDLLERVFDIDLFDRLPMLTRAAQALPQYRLPNGRMVGFGDTRYDLFSTRPVERLLAYAQRRGRSQEARQLADALAALQAGGARSSADTAKPIHALLRAEPPRLATAAVPSSSLQTPTFYSANTSWHVQRNGYASPKAADEALVISLVGSNGNHAHANGLAMELFTKGMSLLPESGRGSGYFQKDYADYYSQFPAHNTVVVDGISTYPAMQVEQPFQLLASYPAPGLPLAQADPAITLAEVQFVEPASQADQRRLLATVRVSETQAYALDVFRSRRQAGKDKYHDYILHGLGQRMAFLDGSQPLATAPSHQLSFADGDLYGYEYWFDKQSLKHTGPLQARFDLALPDRQWVMKVWLQGGGDREFFSVKAPPSTAWPRDMQPSGLDRWPSPTLVVRQTGAAWNRPFAVVMEGARAGEAPAVQSVRELPLSAAAAGGVGLELELANQRRHLVLSSATSQPALRAAGAQLAGRMGLVGWQAGRLERLFLADGRSLAAAGGRIECLNRLCAASVWLQDGHWHYSADSAVRLKLPGQAAVSRPASGPARVH